MPREIPAAVAALLVGAYLATIAWAIDAGHLPAMAGPALLILNGATFVIYALDKHGARRGHRRVPENTLHLLELLGGWPAALLAQKALRHKTRKQRYRIGFWLAVVAHCAILGGWLWLA